MLPIDDRGFAGGAAERVLDDLVPPQIAARRHVDGWTSIAEVTQHDHVLDAVRLGLRHGAIDDLLQGEHVAAAVPAVLRDHDLRLAVPDALRDRLGGEAAEDDGVDGAEARAGQHRDGDLGDHAPVDRDAVAGLDAEARERIRELDRLAIQLGVRHGAGLAELTLPQDRGLVLPPRRHVPVEAALGDVELRAHEPLDEGELRGSFCALLAGHARPGLTEHEILGLSPPERVRVVEALLVEALVVFAGAHPRARGELLGRREAASLFEDARNGLVRHGFLRTSAGGYPKAGRPGARPRVDLGGCPLVRLGVRPALAHARK